MPDEQNVDWSKVKQFAGTMMNDLGAAMQGALSYIGDRLGLFKALAEMGAVTSDELAAKTGLNERYLREWLGAMTAARYINFDPATRRFLMPREHAMILADETSPFFMGGFMQMVVPEVGMAPKLLDSFRTGKGIPQSEYPPEVFEAIERGSAPMYRHSLIRKWMPTMPQAVAALEAGGTALDVGCGSGRAVIALATAYPKARVHGYDGHAGSIERARANARAAGVGDRVTFEVVDCTKLPQAQFDFITTFDVIHDSVDPVGLLKSIRGALKPGGTYLMVEVNVSDKLEDNISPMGRMMYSASTLYCMTVSLAHGGAGIGALMGEAKAREMTQQAGFTSFNRLPVKDAFSVLYEIRS
ncbi:MAG TPA: class I SAM-dependent methyltransferase [Candidatus Binataceae bacterium]|jgi:2-polyprenyl-3-methyl-5-hydroxy-6-metoxy-1,4-benzoquinol methylase|nr:class I SAM-dependent methyltransferase [Candidatus Binataceae bacterium]